MVFYLLALAGDESVKAILRMQNDEAETVLHEAVRLEDKDVVGVLLSADSQSQLARVMGRMVNKEQAQSKPNEGFQLHHLELLIAAAHGDSDEIKRLLLLHREEDAARQPVEVVLDVTDIEDTVADDVEKPAATAMPPSQAVTGAEHSVLHVVASSGDGDEFLECATVIVGKANHLLGACNRKGDTPLHCAARLRNARMLSHLLALARAGDGTSDDERVKAILRVQNDKEETVLHEAIRLEDKEMIDVLLSADSQLARVPLTDGASPLYLALSLGHWDIALQLFEKDKELSYSGPDGENALHVAIQRECGEEIIIEMLLERNKDLIKQADRSTGSTPLHFAAKWGAPMGLLLEADPAAAYVPESNGSFPIHIAASNGQPDNVLALLQDKKSGPYFAQLRDGKGRTFLHVAAQKDESWEVVKYACQEQGKMFTSSVMNMQDDQGNTALHLAVEVGDIRVVHALVSIPEVKLNLTNNKGETPRELAFSKVPKGPYSRYSSPPSRIYWLLRDAAHLTASPRERILPSNKKDTPQSIVNQRTQVIGLGSVLITTVTFAAERILQSNKKDTSQSIVDQRTQVIGLGSVLITTVTFAAAFAVPGGYRADGTPALAGQYAFDAFVAANTLAFIFSGLSTIFLMFAGLGTESVNRVFSLLRSIDFLAWSARSLGAAFALGMYAVLAPVERMNAICYCFITVGALLLVESEWGFRAVKKVYSDNVVLVKRFGISRARLRLAQRVLLTLNSEFGPYIVMACLGKASYSGRK